MSWDIAIYFQERGTKRETSERVTFSSRAEAVAALEKLTADLEARGDDQMIVVDAGGDRVDFVKRDFRRTSLYEVADGPIVIGDSWSNRMSDY